MAKASKRTIPESIKKQANEIVKSFNGNVIKDSQCYYTTRYRGTYLYHLGFQMHLFCGNIRVLFRLDFGQNERVLDQKTKKRDRERFSTLSRSQQWFGLWTK